MRRIEYTGQFKRDYKRESKGRHKKAVREDLQALVELLAADRPFPAKCYSHVLSGNWADHRDCHVKPDLVLIYRKPGDGALQLVRLGSHSELEIGRASCRERV